jgi:thiosulfate/3-mercaptopyruvate sulfurtransferase
VRYQFVDCRWELGSPEKGRELYLAGHVPGASFLDVERELSAPPSTPGGRHPLPAAEDFARAAGAAGIGAGVFVVAYDQGMNGGAARLWWLLRHFGHDDVAVLDGGTGAWLGPLRAGEEEIEAKEFTARPRSGDTIEAEELENRLGDERLTIVDARLPERYRGEVEPIDPVAGRIPGAVNAPYPQELPPELAEARELVAYCGSGITAAVVLLRLAQAGRDDAKLYPGSWSDWSGRGLPAETG